MHVEGLVICSVWRFKRTWNRTAESKYPSGAKTSFFVFNKKPYGFFSHNNIYLRVCAKITTKKYPFPSNAGALVKKKETYACSNFYRNSITKSKTSSALQVYFCLAARRLNWIKTLKARSQISESNFNYN